MEKNTKKNLLQLVNLKDLSGTKKNLKGLIYYN